MSASAADLVLDANYEGPHADDAEYFAAGTPPVAGAGASCRVMRGGVEAGLDLSGLASRPVLDAPIIRVRVKELAGPAKGGVFLLTETGEAFQVTAAPERLDRARREWTCVAIEWQAEA